jgi:hypothetical protein
MPHQGVGMPPGRQRLIFDGELMIGGKTLADYRVQKGSTVHLIMSLRGDIGWFGRHAGSPGLELLMNTAQAGSTLEDAQAVVHQLGGRPGSRHRSFFAPPLSQFRGRSWENGPDSAQLLPQRARDALVRSLDTAHRRTPCADLKQELSKRALAELVGGPAAAKLAALFAEPVDGSIRRRTEATPGACIAFHLDHSERTMQLPLNDPAEYEGGRLVFATAERGLEQPTRAVGSVVRPPAPPRDSPAAPHAAMVSGSFGRRPRARKLQGRPKSCKLAQDFDCKSL